MSSIATEHWVARPFAALLTAVLSFSLMQTMVVPALPDLQRAFDTDTTTVSWVLSAFLLTASVATGLLGRLGDMFGKRRMLLATMLVFAVGTLLAALAGSIGTLIAARAVQGVGAATFPLAFGIVRDEFPRAGAGRDRLDQLDVRDRLRRRPRDPRPDRRRAGLGVDLLARPRGDPRRNGRGVGVRARVTGAVGGPDRLGRGSAAAPGWSRSCWRSARDGHGGRVRSWACLPARWYCSSRSWPRRGESGNR